MFPFQAVAKRSASAGGDEGCSLVSVMQHSLNGQKESLGSLCPCPEGGRMDAIAHPQGCFLSKWGKDISVLPHGTPSNHVINGVRLRLIYP